ncbi:unnamed protein product, partial [Phaeothamnion confervicola]
MAQIDTRPSVPVEAFERKIRWSRIALFIEGMWPRLWLIVGLAALFVVVSLAGLWDALGITTHKISLAVFFMLLAASLFYAVRAPWPTRDDAVRRMERGSGVPHRPATSYEDTLSLNKDDPTTGAIWQAHRQRLAAQIERLGVGRPRPRTDRRDPFAIRAALLLGVVTLLGLVGDGARDRMWAAFRFGPPLTAAEARLDAWITPPAYTGRPPVLLADGARGGLLLAGSDGKPVEVPESSIIIARSSGKGSVVLELDVKPEGGPAVRQAAATATEGAEASEVRYTVKKSGQVRVLGNGSELA